MKLALFIIILLLMSIFFVISENNLSLREKENLTEFKEIYVDWAKKAGTNTLEVTGNIIKMDWKPDE